MKTERLLINSMLIVILTVCSVFVIAGGSIKTYAEPSEKVYNLYVQGKHVTSVNCKDILLDGTVSYDPESNTLTLNNATIEMSKREYGFSGDKNEYGIRANLGSADEGSEGTAVTGALTIKLIGSNKIVNAEPAAETTNKYGITVSSSDKVIYTGGGTLDVTMDASESGKRYVGVEAHQPTTLDGVKMNVNIGGSGDIVGVYMMYSNELALQNKAEMHIDVGGGYALDNNRDANKDLSVASDCIFEAISSGSNGALHGHNYIQLTDDTKALGVLVNKEPVKDGASKWDGETDFANYQYVRIPYPAPTPKPAPAPAPAPAAKAKAVLVARGIASGKKAVNLSWNNVGADRYVIYMARCKYKGKKYRFSQIRVVNGKTFKMKKSKLKRKTAYKFYVVAQKKSGGKYVNIAKSAQAHVFTGNVRGSYTNPKNLKLKKTAFTLSKGKTATIKGTVSKVRKGKKVATSHAKLLRFTSNNPAVATVNASGKITAKSKGTAVIYVQTINGIWKTCKVTVK